MACAGNNEGARSAEADLARLAGPLNVMTKNKCRVFWSEPLQGAADPELLQQWLRQDAQRPIAGGRFVSRPGVFAWDRVDIASALLANQLPSDLAGRAADLGAGYGYLSARLLAHCPSIESLAVFEAEARALDLARQNLAPFESGVAIDYHWHDVTSGLPGSYDVIVTNPPFHVQRGVSRPDIGRRFIAVAAAALRDGGRLWLVANRHLPYEAELAHNFANLRTVVQEHGFKIVEAIKRQRVASTSVRPGSGSPRSAPTSTGRARTSPALGRHR
jgi:16S rRNA (guanine1207-N2)-methyltransferase